MPVQQQGAQLGVASIMFLLAGFGGADFRGVPHLAFERFGVNTVSLLSSS
jgi:hypothetical protein